MNPNRCATCDEVGTRIDAPMTLGDITVQDSYCGACGVNWGVLNQAIRDQKFLKKRRLMKPFDHNWRQVAR